MATETDRRAQELGAAMLNAAGPYMDVKLDKEDSVHCHSCYASALGSPIPFPCGTSEESSHDQSSQVLSTTSSKA